MHNIIGERLRRLMAERALSATQLAKAAQVKPSFIYDVIHGKSTNPSVIKLAQIAHSLDISISALLEGIPAHAPRAEDAPQAEPLLLPDAARSEDYVTISGTLAEGSMGGRAPLAENKPAPYHFHRDWIHARFGVTPHNLRVISVRGDSMEPSLCAGDTVLIDTTRKSPSPPGIFVLFDGIGLVVKRLEFIANTTPPAIRIISDNPQYKAYQHPLDALHIIGRVVWFSRQL